MTLIPDALLSGLRTVADSVRSETARISRATPTADGQGGVTDAWATVAAVSCYVTAMRTQAAEGVVADQLQGRVGFYVYLPHDADVRAQDRLVVGTRTYEVLGVQAPTSLLVHVRADCVRQD
jgi:SPP1 family predicted phage head-tail adaptor